MPRSLFLRLIFLAGAVAIATPAKPQVRFLTYEEARTLLQSLDDALPTELNGKTAEEQAALWPAWVKAQDAAVRARLRRGDEDTLVNFLLFGVSFTRQPRVTAQELSRSHQSQAQDAFDRLINARIDDLIRSLGDQKAAGQNERLRFLRKLVIGQGMRPEDPAGRAKLREYILAN